MPSIVAKNADLQALLGKDLSYDELEGLLTLVKGELKRRDSNETDLKIELNDTNRPDTWTVEGIARQLRYHLGFEQPDYNFFAKTGKYEVIAKKDIAAIRPAIGAFVVRNINITEEVLEQIIQTQEKLCENFGSKRRSVAIGVYNLDAITFPVYYRSEAPEGFKFIALGDEEPKTLGQILVEHQKGKQYAHLVNKFPRYPLLIDAQDNVLSFPPIINSRLVGEVKTDSTNLFIEATGDDLEKITLALNILAYNLTDRGGEILPVTVRYEEKLNGHSQLTFPLALNNSAIVEHDLFEKMLGVKLAAEDVVAKLKQYGCIVSVEQGKYNVATLSYRNDYLHPVDVVEDYFMSCGYDNVGAASPSCFTVGKLHQVTEFTDKARNILVGCGFEEVFSSVLMSKEAFGVKSLISEPLVEIDNVMTETCGVVRNSLLPCLFGVEATSAKALYPHKMFEVGDVAIVNPREVQGSSTDILCAFAIAHAKAGFSEIHSILDVLTYYLGAETRLEHKESKTFISGRSASIFVGEVEIGVLGEVHPEVLTNWDLKVPVVACEINISRLNTISV
ncbi:MAG: phenylalanine--tRNA ligase subunit beta [Deltaproteobacteria bacterium]|nr:phenylalanine--tRNA ligase subunit beta [Deltaproteobacteria bacterium]